jgi:1-acyl-sn-glycerol-3-phosphate acyltransferase
LSPALDDLKEVAKGWRWTRRSLLPRTAEPWAPPEEPREFPTDWARTRAGRAARRILFGSGLRAIVWHETSPHVEGVDVLDQVGPPVMFFSNHSSHLDAPLVLGALPPKWRDRTAVAAAADYFFDVWWRAAGTALLLNAIPIERSGGKRATVTARRLVEEGWNLVVFPEGTRSQDGWVGRFRYGAARLCVQHGMPAVPVAIRGSFAAMPRGRGWAAPGRSPISMRFGWPIRPQPDEGHRAFSGRMQDALARVWDEDASTWWESLRRSARAETPALTGPPAASWRRMWEASRPLPRRERPRVWPR